MEGCSYLANVSRPERDTAKAKKEDFWEAEFLQHKESGTTKVVYI